MKRKKTIACSSALAVINKKPIFNGIISNVLIVVGISIVVTENHCQIINYNEAIKYGCAIDQIH